MKTLLLARHAKSSWDYPELSDFERPLSKRGHRDAPLMGKLLARLGIQPDIIISSPANRALSTARLLAEEMKYPLMRIDVRQQLYEASMEDMLDVLHTVDNGLDMALLVGHNPGLTQFCNGLAAAGIGNIPTCGVAGIRCKEDDWSTITPGSGSLYLYEYPKKYAA